MSAVRTLPHFSRLAKSSAIASGTRIAPRIWSRSSARNFSAVRRLQEKYYTQSHEWIELDSDSKTGSIGISAHAASALGDIVYVELPEEGAELKAGDAMGAVESVKSASDLYIPIGGKVIETNKEVDETPSLINKSPETRGWIARIELSEGEADRVKELMNAEDYKKFSE